VLVAPEAHVLESACARWAKGRENGHSSLIGASALETRIHLVKGIRSEKLNREANAAFLDLLVENGQRLRPNFVKPEFSLFQANLMPYLILREAEKIL
jgi:hypothetical protein